LAPSLRPSSSPVPHGNSRLHAPEKWRDAQFDDSSWSAVTASGSIEGNIDFLQWNDDAGLYNWPGYEGASPFLAHTHLTATEVRDTLCRRRLLRQHRRSHRHPKKIPPTSSPFTSLPIPPENSSPAITLDFGREVNGRLQLASDTDSPITVSITYGESLGEVDNDAYLGTNTLHITPTGTAAGPKSAFRYARIRFLAGPAVVKFRAIRLDDIYYPVHYQGSFESSDAAPQPHLGNRRLHHPPLHAGRHLGRTQARPRPLDGRH
jgi:alpha-L-rhamnosidase